MGVPGLGFEVCGLGFQNHKQGLDFLSPVRLSSGCRASILEGFFGVGGHLQGSVCNTGASIPTGSLV